MTLEERIADYERRMEQLRNLSKLIEAELCGNQSKLAIRRHYLGIMDTLTTPPPDADAIPEKRKCPFCQSFSVDLITGYYNYRCQNCSNKFRVGSEPVADATLASLAETIVRDANEAWLKQCIDDIGKLTARVERLEDRVLGISNMAGHTKQFLEQLLERLGGKR